MIGVDNVKEFQVICIDMFQTLVNIYTRRNFIWQRILGEEYSLELQELYGQQLDRQIFEKFHIHISESKEFFNLKSIFEIYFSQIFKENNLSYEAKKAAEIFTGEHGYAVPYEDTEMFLDIVGKKYPICLVSDADFNMVAPLLKKFKFDKVFISEEVGAYKKDSENKMFKKVLEHYAVEPGKILHIGDSSSDIIGASNLGISTCWINRHDYKLKSDVEPTYKVKTLIEVLSILGIEVDNNINIGIKYA